MKKKQTALMTAGQRDERQRERRDIDFNVCLVVSWVRKITKKTAKTEA